MNTYTIGNNKLRLKDIAEILTSELTLSEGRREKIQTCRDYLEKKIYEENGIYYGINTGFGSLCNVVIEKDQIEELQYNLVRSHAAGAGDAIPHDLARCILFLKIQNLSLGYSGVRTELIDQMIKIYNAGVVPLIYELGSLGASGDLAPLAHMALVLIGEGEAIYKNRVQDSADILEALNISPIKLKAKEGLALLNGTQFSTAYGVLSALRAEKLLRLAIMNTAASLYAFNCRTDPYYAPLHHLRKQKGQIQVAEEVLHWLQDSDIDDRKRKDVQDPYAFRCVPQVLGATLDTLDYVKSILENEINAVTDNPTIIPEEDRIISGGNFHAQPIALILDQLGIAMSEAGNIAERRIFQLTTGNRGLPPYLSPNPGINSGVMIPQYTAAAIVSQNKQLATPASVDSITSSLGQEDHVSMAANAATKLWRILNNIEEILSIEFMVNAQAIGLLNTPKKPPRLQPIIEQYRLLVPQLENDRIMYVDMKKTKDFLKEKEYL